MKFRLSIIAEEPEWLVVDKPAHLLVHPTRPNGPVTLLDQLKEVLVYELVNGGQVSLIQRLDRETSGLMLVAKTNGAASFLSTLLMKRRLEKEYLALVSGWPDWESIEVNAPISRAGTKVCSPIWLKQMVHPDGAKAVTEFEVVERFETSVSEVGNRFCLLKARPKTGRLHQIRVHAKHIGYPIVGDKIYGPDENCYLEFIETGWSERLERKLLFNRHALHAHSLRFEDQEGILRTYVSELPRDMKEFCDLNLKFNG